MPVLARVAGLAGALTLAACGLVTVAAPASAAPCPGGETPCVYLPGATYTLGNPVTTSTGVGPSTTTVLKHCDSTGTDCDYTYLNLPGLVLSSTSTAILTLTVPGEGVGLNGTVPTLYLGVPSVSGPGTTSLGLSLTVSGTAFVLYDTLLNPIVACAAPKPVPANPVVTGTYGCSFTLTVSV